MTVLKKKLNNISYMSYKACKIIFLKNFENVDFVACVFVNCGFFLNPAERACIEYMFL